MSHEEREKLADQFLDAALKQYSAAEPRPGLETRILANLATATPRRLFAFPHIAWAAVAAFALLAITFGIWQHRRPAQSAHAPAAIEPSVPAPLPPTPAAPIQTTHNAAVATRRHRVPLPQPPVEEAMRQEQFPSPQPFSEDERLLLTYLRTTPREEVLVVLAQLQAEREEGMKRFNADPPLGH
jgi:hypothetical protein